MEEGLHLELIKIPMDGSSFSQGQLTLNEAGDFTVQIKEYKELRERSANLKMMRGKPLLNPSIEKELADISILLAKFNTVNWVLSTAKKLDDTSYHESPTIIRGIPVDGKSLSFPAVLEGGGYVYVEAFFEGKSPIGRPPNGMLIRATGIPKIVRVEWTDMQYNPIKDTKVAFGSHVLLHIYTQGLYGQEILVELKHLSKKLNIANSDYIEGEVKMFPAQSFEKGKNAVTDLITYGEKESTAALQKAEIKVGIDYQWLLTHTPELLITTNVLQKTTWEQVKLADDSTTLETIANVLSMQDDRTILHVSSDGENLAKTLTITNNPVVVSEIDTVANSLKKPIDFTFGIFLDGTLNSMYNTEVSQKAKGDSVKNNDGLVLNRSEASKIYNKDGFKDPKYGETSYENDLSNPAILFKNYKDKNTDTEKIFKIYTEGVGTNSSPKLYDGTRGALSEDDYKKDDDVYGPAFGMGNAGIMDKVKKGIGDVVEMIKTQNIDEDHCVGTITFDVFGFSRGAAAARHFVHVVTHSAYKPVQSFLPKYVLDLQHNEIDKAKYYNKIMPQFGVLGQLLTEAELMDDVLTKVAVRFVGIYDSVPHHGLFQTNDIEDLGLNNVNRADYVVHMIAADEYRMNFSLVEISTVAKTPPESGKKGGVELRYPGVHCDVGGAYVEGGSNHPYRINIAYTSEDLEKEKLEFVQQGWFKKKELSIHKYLPILPLADQVLLSKSWRLEGYKENVSNQYSYIPLHLMAQFCELKEVPIKEVDIINLNKYNFTPKNALFLNNMKTILKNYSFSGSTAPTFENFPKEIANLRYHFLHWNATYGDPQEARGTWLSGKNAPNWDEKNSTKRKRHVR